MAEVPGTHRTIQIAEKPCGPPRLIARADRRRTDSESLELRLVVQRADEDVGQKNEIERKREHGLLMSDPTWQAIILLGLNCGYGNTDLSGLSISVLDFSAGWITYRRVMMSTVLARVSGGPGSNAPPLRAAPPGISVVSMLRRRPPGKVQTGNATNRECTRFFGVRSWMIVDSVRVAGVGTRHE